MGFQGWGERAEGDALLIRDAEFVHFVAEGEVRDRTLQYCRDNMLLVGLIDFEVSERERAQTV